MNYRCAANISPDRFRNRHVRIVRMRQHIQINAGPAIILAKIFSFCKGAIGDRDYSPPRLPM
jgi:hypothetical protein